jgi:hypothetical protein
MLERLGPTSGGGDSDDEGRVVKGVGPSDRGDITRQHEDSGPFGNPPILSDTNSFHVVLRCCSLTLPYDEVGKWEVRRELSRRIEH